MNKYAKPDIKGIQNFTSMMKTERTYILISDKMCSLPKQSIKRLYHVYVQKRININILIKSKTNKNDRRKEYKLGERDI